MIDIFFSTCAESEERKEIAARCLAFWHGLPPPYRVCVVTPELLGCNRREFQRGRRIYADMRARGPIYCLTDDDCCPGGKDDVAKGFEALCHAHEFAIVSSFPVNCTINPWTPDNYPVSTTETVMEHVSVGGTRFCRRRIFLEKDWPAMGIGPGYDAIHANALREKNWRVGYAVKSQMIHWGEGKSEVWT